MNQTYEEVIQACDDSIAHWGRMATGTQYQHEGRGADSCALCSIFLHRGCSGCPVSKKTKMAKCFGSPYPDAVVHDINSRAGRTVALRMRDFLIEAKAEYIAKHGPKTEQVAATPDPRADPGRRALTVEECRYILTGSGIVQDVSVYSGSHYLPGYVAQGNGFTTYEVAERERDRRAVLQKLRAMPGAREKFKRGKDNHTLVVSGMDGTWNSDNWKHSNYLCPVCFDNHDQAQAAIAILGDEFEVLR